ncbi:MAG: hypothetical protein HQ486_07740 [Acidimicrobiaceae bacterium]|nr:hypothetical protein [Acidimicrobiaceae bacterium]
MFAIITIVIWQIFRSLSAVFVIVNAIFIHLSGALPIRVFQIFEYLFTSSLSQTTVETIRQTVQVHSRMYLMIYDFPALAFIFVVVILLERKFFERASFGTLFIFGAIATSIFEHLVIVTVVAYISFYHRHKYRQLRGPVTALCLGAISSLGVAVTVGTIANDGIGSSLAGTYASFAQSNLQHLDQIIAGFLIVLVPALFYGFIIGVILPQKYIANITISTSIKNSIRSLIIGLVFTYSIGLFSSGLSSELSRQTLGLQVLLILYSFVLIVKKRQGLRVRISN